MGERRNQLEHRRAVLRSINIEFYSVGTGLGAGEYIIDPCVQGACSTPWLNLSKEGSMCIWRDTSVRL